MMNMSQFSDKMDEISFMETSSILDEMTFQQKFQSVRISGTKRTLAHFGSKTPEELQGFQLTMLIIHWRVC